MGKTKKVNFLDILLVGTKFNCRTKILGETHQCPIGDPFHLHHHPPPINVVLS